MKIYNIKNGRPKKSAADKYTYRITAKLRTEDYYTFKAKAMEAGMTVGELSRLVLTGVRIVPRITPEQAGWLRSLSGMGNNLNQIARRANSAGYEDARNLNIDLARRIDEVLNQLEK